VLVRYLARVSEGSLRRAEARDVPALEMLASAAYSMDIPRVGRLPAPMTADYAAAVAGAAEVWVVEEAGRVVGLLVLVPEDDHLLLENVAVHPSAQWRGIGARLLAHAEARAGERSPWLATGSWRVVEP
jgi:N-acetylglutamate synthase-like GNAT family acetyltransferase